MGWSIVTLKVAVAPTATDVLAGWAVMTGAWVGPGAGAGGGDWVGAEGVGDGDGLPGSPAPPALQPANNACTTAHAAAFWPKVIFTNRSPS